MSHRRIQGSLPGGTISNNIVSSDLSPEKRIRSIKILLADKEEQLGAKRLEPGNASRFVELLDQDLRANRLDERNRSSCVRYLARVCGWHSILPNSVKISGHQRDSELAGSAHSEIWFGTYKGRKVAIKVAKFYVSFDEEEKKKLTVGFCKEVIIWKHLNHPNILPFIGATMVVEPGREKYEIVSEFMENGDIMKFTNKNKGANRLKLLKDAAEGLKYLHSQSVVHGDLKGQNVLINKDRRACLADFGLTRVLAEFSSSGPKDPGGTPVWMSPEMLMPADFNMKDGKPTKKSDVYALGILIYEVVCGYRPHPESGPHAAVEKLLQNILPVRPGVGFTDSLWRTLERCWQHDSERRPDLDIVLRKLDEASRA